MKIILDAMGGDNAPQAVVQGALEAHAQCGADIVLVGREEAIRACLTGPLPEGVEIVNATEVVDMCDDPATAFKRKKDSSLTCLLYTSPSPRDVYKRQPVLPTATGRALLCDCGANADCTPEYLLQFAYLGSFYAQRLMGVEKPRVGLLNIGSEPSKGDTLRHETFALLEEAGREGRLNFIGNVEANTALLGGADVIVADGYSGNILLKTVEGAAKLLLGEMKKAFLSSTKSKLGALLIKDSLGDVKKLLDPSEVGGTPFLGISKPVLKAHGSSDARAIRNAVFRAVEYAQSGIIADVEAHIDVMKVEKNG